MTGGSQTITVDIPDFGGLAGFQLVRSPSAVSGEVMTVLGDVSLASGSTATIDIGLSGFSDLLDVAGNLGVADGFMLEVLLDSSVTASELGPGDSWKVFDFATSTGTASQADFALPALATGLAWNTSDLLVDGTISIGLVGDFNGDGSVDIADYTVWRDNLNSTDESLIANAGVSDGVINVADYLAWKGNFGATVGDFAALSSLAAAPEPTSAALCVAALGVASLSRRRNRLAARNV